MYYQHTALAAATSRAPQLLAGKRKRNLREASPNGHTQNRATCCPICSLPWRFGRSASCRPCSGRPPGVVRMRCGLRVWLHLRLPSAHRSPCACALRHASLTGGLGGGDGRTQRGSGREGGTQGTRGCMPAGALVECLVVRWQRGSVIGGA